MASSLHPPYEPLVVVVEEEDYIDMDISSSASSSLLCYSSSTKRSAPPHCSRDFEFQMSSKPLAEIDGIISPADELFYKGKLLPLHLPPRLQLLQKLLQDSITSTYHHANADIAATATATPYDQSYNISPATSCCVSGELNSEDYFVEEYCRKDTKKSWANKFKLFKQSSSLCHKLKAPKAYLKSLFTSRSRSPGHIQKAANLVEEITCGHRQRSFSAAIKSCSASSSCCSSNSSSFSSTNSEVECSILGAIDYSLMLLRLLFSTGHLCNGSWLQ